MDKKKVINESKIVGYILSFDKLDKYYEFYYNTGETGRLYILNDHVIRFYMSPTGHFKDYPEPINPNDTAKINAKKMSEYGLVAFEKSTFIDDDRLAYIIDTEEIRIAFDKISSLMTVVCKKTNKVVFSESQSLCYYDHSPTQTLEQHEDEYFYGGGMQNGRFSHKGEIIKIANTNKWEDGGVTSPCPFFWSTYGYGILRNTWQPGVYDFGHKSSDVVRTSHKGDGDFDAFYFINSKPRNILSDYYELTGRPIFMPEYAFYEAHLDAFNRDYWVEVLPDAPRAVLFEDGKYYKCYKPKEMKDKTGILESLNGEKNNYQFSARGMIDRYKRHDMPLGWFVPNDGYGCGYGQTDSLDGDIENLKEFAEYSRSNGIEVALWTESNLHPVDPNHPKKGERDLVKEVGVAGVVALKCDVAWIGSGYSFGLSAVEDATEVFISNTKKNVRPLIIMVDGWAGTHRYSGIWSGDQKGGLWEYIRFHIPSFIGCSLSGQPVIGSDMDGIYGGGVKEINIRDYQWKTFTPLQLNMDGWGDKTKTPFTYDDDATDINRAYLKLKSMLMPYNYTIGHESTEGLPMIRAMFLEFPKEKLAFTKTCQYQFMWGPNILVAPVYNADSHKGTRIRNGIFLPGDGETWIDFFTGEKYKGGKVVNEFICPLWKIPIFVKNGAIIPMVNPNNNPNEIERNKRIFTLYPDGESNFEVYEDDGLTSSYTHNDYAITQISMIGPKCNKLNQLYIYISKTHGSYIGMIEERSTLLQVMASEEPKDIIMIISGKHIDIVKAEDGAEFQKHKNVYFFKKDFIINPYLVKFNDDPMSQKFILIKIQDINVTTDEIQLIINGYDNKSIVFGNLIETETLSKPSNLRDTSVTSTSITLKWDSVKNAQYYEIEKDDVIYTNIKSNTFTLKGLNYESMYSFRVRTAINLEVSEWSNISNVYTLGDPYKDTVEDVVITHEVTYETYKDSTKEVQDETSDTNSDCEEPRKRKIVTLRFDLGEIRNIRKVCYIQPDDINTPGLIYEYCFSVDGENWFDFISTVTLDEEKTAKKITYTPKTFRFMEIRVRDSEFDFDNGKQVVFYKALE